MSPDQTKPRSTDTEATDEKVGSSRKAAAEQPGGSQDFGIPASRAGEEANTGGRDKGPEEGTGYSRSGSRGVRTVGVGAPVGSDGSGSGGDLDADVIGLDGTAVSLNPGERRTRGPDQTDGRTDPFASGPPAQGRPYHAPPAPLSDRPPLDTVDHSGGDVTTSGDESSEATNPEIEEIAQEADLDRGV